MGFKRQLCVCWRLANNWDGGNDVQAHLFAIVVVLVLLSHSALPWLGFEPLTSHFAFRCLLLDVCCNFGFALSQFCLNFRNSLCNSAHLQRFLLCFSYQNSICLYSLLNLLDSDLATVLQQHTVSVERVGIDIIRELTIDS
jgi:hypothetical protein